jgi:hypothetical protein
LQDRRGGADTHKLRRYARLGIPYYAIFDRRNLLGQGVLRAFALSEGVYRPLDTAWLAQVGLGLTLWEGEYEGCRGTWLRWCDREGNPIPTGQERGKRVAEQAERLRAQLRALGINPDA